MDSGSMSGAGAYRVTLAPSDPSLLSRLDGDPLLANRFVPRGTDSGSGLGAETVLTAVLTVQALRTLVSLARVWASDRRSQVRVRVSSGGLDVTVNVNGRSDPAALLQQILDQLDRRPAPPARDVKPVDPPAGERIQHNTANGGGTVIGVQGGNIVFPDGAPARVPGGGQPAASGHDRIRILMLAANPAATPHLALDEEAREIEQKLRLSRDRDAFELTTRWAVRPDDLLRFLNEFNPHIVHFSGHGDSAGQIVLSAGDGTGRSVQPTALAEVFRVMRHSIRVAMLNACYSAVQAQAIGKHIDYVVGMRAPVHDDAAIVFSAAFYSGLGYGRPVVEAFEQGIAAVMVHGLDGSDIPQLLARHGADPHLRIVR